MRFIDNWLTQLSTALGSAESALPVPGEALQRLDLASGGEYLLTLTASLAPSAQLAWEVIRVSADAQGNVQVARGQAGTVAQDWDQGAYIYASLTAGHMVAITSQLDDLNQRLTALEGAGDPGGVLTDGAGNVLVDDLGNVLTGA